ncbi:MAG TPA: hypothetical protein VML93_07170 [Mycobacterium sp.]|nr:hypothetical protein [Mycobacterium sp.]
MALRSAESWWDPPSLRPTRVSWSSPANPSPVSQAPVSPAPAVPARPDLARPVWMAAAVLVSRGRSGLVSPAGRVARVRPAPADLTPADLEGPAFIPPRAAGSAP